MKILQSIIVVFSVLLIFSCGTDGEDAAKLKVTYHGALKNMMKKGDISAKASLKEFENTDHLYAIGAFENLKGEIQIFDSKVFNTMVTDSSVIIDKSLSQKATLLVYATVNKWKSLNVPDHINTYKQLEKFIRRAAKENQINIKQPFPFLLEGTPKSIDWHIINWKDGDTEHSHEKHISSGLHGAMKNRKVEMLGFYSDSHQGIFTHHTTNLHIHFKTADDKLAGHVDGFTLSRGMILKLPKEE